MDVQPDKQNIDQVFGSTVYYIDFYQRQYKWEKDPVLRLLDDVFYKFNEEDERHKAVQLSPQRLIEKYAWYYLNTYVTNKDKETGRLYVVDGQQRLTTLTLMLICLRHMAREYESKLYDWISQKISGTKGYDRTFWMNHENHLDTLLALFNGDEQVPDGPGITGKNMKANYDIITKRLQRELSDKERFERFVFFFLQRLVIIQLNVEQTDVPMVFEVINDRGVRLKPYEILKGKLLGQIDKESLNVLNLNNLWEKQVNAINAYSSEYTDEVDNFFIAFLRSKFSDTVSDSRKFDKGYHRSIFSNTDLDLDHNPGEVKKFLLNDFKYYSDLYLRLLKLSRDEHKDYRHIYYNWLTQRDSQLRLILAACLPNDPDEDEKIKVVSFEVDRMVTLLQLQRCYSGGNRFNELSYLIGAKIRDKDIETIRAVFNEALIDELKDKLSIPELAEPFSYSYFKDTGIDLDKRFKRYLFARVEQFIADNTSMNMRHNIYNLVANTGAVNGFHIEHIIADNEENHHLFNDDPEYFNSQRNRLGGLLLLKGKDNESSNNETYDKKLESYANTLYWNESLRADTYKSKLDFQQMIEKFDLAFRPLEKFGPEELEERHKLLYNITKIIWKG